MKYHIVLIGLLIIFTYELFGRVDNYVDSSGSAEVTTPISSKNELKKHVEYLCSFKHPRNKFNISSLDTAASYIFTNFKLYTSRVEYQPYDAPCGRVKNVIASFGPENGKRIIVGAHYDVCGNQPGADDNASGIAGLIEIARLLSKEETRFKYRVDIVAYTLEEPPYFRSAMMGSYIHAQSLYQKGIEVEVMICLEMIGYFTEEPNSQEYPSILGWFYPDQGNFIACISNFSSSSEALKVKQAISKYSRVPVEKIFAPSFISGIDFSDHMNYWKFDYPAVMITDTAFMRNSNYHEKTDLPETLNYEKMAEVVLGVYHSLFNM